MVFLVKPDSGHLLPNLVQKYHVEIWSFLEMIEVKLSFDYILVGRSKTNIMILDPYPCSFKSSNYYTFVAPSSHQPVIPPTSLCVVENCTHYSAPYASSTTE